MYTHIHAYGKPYLVPLWPLFGFMDFQSEKNHKFCREPSNDHSYQVWVQFDQWN
jgi:hypothetical protein